MRVHVKHIAFLVTALPLVAKAAAAQGERPAKCRDCDTAQRDVLVRARRFDYEREIERLAREVAEKRQQQILLSRQLQHLIDEQKRDAQAVVRANLGQALRRLQLQREDVARAGSALRAELGALCSRNARPSGWMGLAFSGNVRISRRSGGPPIYRFLHFPTVETVEPGSPAERAGIESGDEILDIDGRDVRSGDVNFVSLLKPGSALSLRLRRDGRVRELTMVIKPRPETLTGSCPWLDETIAAALAEGPVAFQYEVPPPVAMVAPRAPRAARQPTPVAEPSRHPSVEVPAPREPREPREPLPPEFRVITPVPALPPVRPVPPQQQYDVIVGARRAVIAGAEFASVNADMREVLGVDRGVLVLDVAPGTPAAQAGLKAGDVVVSTDGVPVSSPATVRRIIGQAGDRSVTLQIIRKRRPQTLLLR